MWHKTIGHFVGRKYECTLAQTDISKAIPNRNKSNGDEDWSQLHNLFQVSSYELVKDVLINKQDIFSGRPFMFKFHGYMNFMEDVAMSNPSPTWRMKKKAMLGSMKM